MLRAFDVVCLLFKGIPVDLRDVGFELVVVFFGALFVRGLAVGAAVVWEVADAADFAEVFPSPCPHCRPVMLLDGNSDGRFMFTPIPLIREPKLKMADRADI